MPAWSARRSSASIRAISAEEAASSGRKAATAARNLARGASLTRQSGSARDLTGAGATTVAAVGADAAGAAAPGAANTANAGGAVCGAGTAARPCSHHHPSNTPSTSTTAPPTTHRRPMPRQVACSWPVDDPWCARIGKACHGLLTRHEATKLRVHLATRAGPGWRHAHQPTLQPGHDPGDDRRARPTGHPGLVQRHVGRSALCQPGVHAGHPQAIGQGTWARPGRLRPEGQPSGCWPSRWPTRCQTARGWTR